MLEQFFPGDMVWVKDMNPRRNKLQQQYHGPFYISRMIGDQEQAAELSLDGTNFITCSVDQLCHYHKFQSAASGSSMVATVAAMAEGVEPSSTWSTAIAPEARQQLEQLAIAELARRGASLIVEGSGVDSHLPPSLDTLFGAGSST